MGNSQNRRNLEQVPTEPLHTTRRRLNRDLDGVRSILRLTGHQIRRNVLAERIEALYTPSDDTTLTAGLHEPWPEAPLDVFGTRWEEWSDRHDARIRAAAQLAFADETQLSKPWQISSDKWHLLALALAESRHANPFVDWLATITPRDHPGLIPNLLPATLGSPLSDLTTWAAMNMLAGPVALSESLHAVPPHEHVVLTGGEGTGKSSLIRLIMPHHEWHDEIELEMDQQRMAEACLGSVLVEWAEMVGAEKVGNAKVRSFLTRQTIKVRLAWGRHPVRVRIPIIVGTTNRDLPKDLAGYRRFVAIEAPGKLPYHELETWMNEHRIHLFETVKYHRTLHETECAQGQCLDHNLHSMLSGHLPNHLKEAQRVANEAHTAPDIITDTLKEIAEKYPQPMPIADIADRINSRLPDKENIKANTLGKYLRAGNWIATRANRHAPRTWTPPTAQLIDTTETKDNDEYF